MTVDEKFKLWQFTELGAISEKAVLVKNNYSGTLMVKYTADKKCFDVFQIMEKSSAPNLMAVYDTVIENDKCVSLCEYIEGVTLEQAVKKRGIYDEYGTVNIIAQLCDGLAVLHKNRIVHRDINPSNVMLDKNGIVKIIDFDILRIVKAGQGRDTQVMGTPGYASPEQFGFYQTDARADIYSCGVLMNYLLSGKLPNEYMYNGNLTPVITRCIEMDPKNRFNSVNELKQVLLGRKANVNTSKKPEKYINYWKLPGFRKGNPFAKFITIFFYIMYIIMFLGYLNFWFQGKYSNDIQEGILTGLCIFVFLTALPYLVFGDFGGMSRLFSWKHPMLGKVITKIIGILSLFIGLYLFCIIPSLYYS